jgi:hypothetical protein
MDVIQLLQTQHLDMRERFDRVETSGVEMPRELELLTEAIALHIELDQRHLSPLMSQLGLEEERYEAAVEDQAIHRMLDDLARCAAEPIAPIQVELLRAAIIGHCAREERHLFPTVAARLSHAARQALAEAMLETMAELENERWLGADHASAR